ncbi:class I SAM-dependent methyltransferase [Candidatus Berkelbacteria bacterium]|nr:class I SAM-dependent methyltransferase [Candidatus Berkelbacteria bacterium]
MGYIVFIFFVFLSLVLLLFALFAVVAVLIGAPFVPSSSDRVSRMVALAKIQPAQLVVDLGSGDGRILIAAARSGARAIGIEINPTLVVLARAKAFLHGLSNQVRVVIGDFRAFNIKDADTIFCYHLPGKMAALEAKIKAEAKPGAKIVLNAFPFPKLKPVQQADHLYVYVI